MTESKFLKFFQDEVKACQEILIAKNDDYSSGFDKLANFKAAGRIDSISPIEALRGMDLKHRVSIQTGLNDLNKDKIRPLEWWQEKLRDHINYMILLHASIYETYFSPDECPF